MTVTVGTKFRYTFADGRPEWTVKAARGAGAWDCVVEEDMDWTGTKKVFGTEEIEAAVRQDQFWDHLTKSTENWWGSLREGEIVHYHNGFGTWVRGHIVKINGENHMFPSALVGAWREYDLPKRARDGSIRYPYHAEKIMQGEPMRPNATNMWEYPEFSRRELGDPSKLPEIDLTVPELDEAAAAEAKIERVRLDAITVLQDGHKDPKAALLKVKALLEGVL